MPQSLCQVNTFPDVFATEDASKMAQTRNFGNTSVALTKTEASQQSQLFALSWQQTIPVGGPIFYVNLGRVDGDDMRDVVAACNFEKGGKGYVYVINGSNNLLWRYLVDGKSISEVAICDLDNDVNIEIIVGLISEGKVSICALDNTGELLWEYETECLSLLKMLVGDLTGDERDDVVFLSDEIHAIRSDGMLLWERPAETIKDIVLGDVDGDQIQDVITASTVGIVDAIKSDGSFLWTWKVGYQIQTIGAGDLDGNWEDEVVLITDPDVSLRVGSNGKLLWQQSIVEQSAIQVLGQIGWLKRESAQLLTITFPIDDKTIESFIVDDFDGDQKDDVVIGFVEVFGEIPTERISIPNIRVVNGSGASIFRKQNVPGCPIALGDVDGDGLKEIVACWLGFVSIIGNDGSVLWSYLIGPRHPHIPPGMYSAVLSIVVGDIDGDGLNEVVCGLNDKNICVLSSDGHLVWFFQSGSNIYDLASGDINNDGKTDLAIAAFHNVYVFDGQGMLLWKYNLTESQVNMSGYYSPTPYMGQFLGCAHKIALADLDGDRLDDIVVAGEEMVYAIKSDGKLLWEIQIPGLHTLIHVGDVNGDGMSDVAIGNIEIGSNLFVIRNDGKLLWSYKYLRDHFGVEPIAVDLGDLDGDGKCEVAAIFGGSHAQIIDDDGSDMWSISCGEVVKNYPRWSSQIIVADVMGDNRLEVIIGGESASYLYVLDGKGKVLWHKRGTYGEGKALLYEPIIVGDTDGDGKNEIVAARQEYGYYNVKPGIVALTGDGTLLWEKERAQEANNIAVGDFDGDGVGEIVAESKLYRSKSGYQFDLYVLGKNGSLIWEHTIPSFDEKATYYPITYHPYLSIGNVEENKSIIFAADFYGRIYAFLLKRAELSEWTFLVYLDGDNDLEEQILKALNSLEKVGSIDNVKIVVQIDRHPAYDSSNGNWTNTRRYYITKDDDPDIVNSEMKEDLGELNMGDPKTLADFIIWSMTKYPARHYGLVLVDHGSGWRAICLDSTSNDDYLTMVELKEALAGSNKTLDLLAFDACLMGMFEVAYQIKDYVKVMIGSEDYVRRSALTIYLPGLPLDAILADLVADPSMEADELARVTVENFRTNYEYRPNWLATLSAIDLSEDRVSNLASDINKLALLLVDKLDPYKAEIKNLRSYISESNEEYGKNDPRDPIDDFDFVDLYCFAQLIKQNINDEIIQNAAGRVMDGINSLIIDEWHQSLHLNSHGISIYFPESSPYSEEYSKLDQSITYHWDEFLKDYEELFSLIYISSMIPAGDFSGLPVYIDDISCETPKWLKLTKSRHSFETIPITDVHEQIFVFDQWEDEKGTILSKSASFTYDLQSYKEFWAVFKPLSAGTVIRLQETRQHLYLHVYDDQGRHVGLNYDTNQTTIDIADAYYFEGLNSTTIILPPSISNFRILVDARYAEKSIETYNLTLIAIDYGQVFNQTSFHSLIQKNEIQGYNIQISPSKEIIGTPYTPEAPWWQQYWYVFPAIFVAAILSGVYLIRRRKKPVMREQLQKLQAMYDRGEISR